MAPHVILVASEMTVPCIRLLAKEIGCDERTMRKFLNNESIRGSKREEIKIKLANIGVTIE